MAGEEEKLALLPWSRLGLSRPLVPVDNVGHGQRASLRAVPPAGSNVLHNDPFDSGRATPALPGHKVMNVEGDGQKGHVRVRVRVFPQRKVAAVP